MYAPIQRRVKAHAEKLIDAGIHEVRRKEYEHFLEAANGKGGLFLDEVDEAEYDPYVLNRVAGNVKVDVANLDPTLRPLQRIEDEKQLNPKKLGSGSARIPLSRHKPMLDTRRWGALHIKATPHGHFASMHKKDEVVGRAIDCAATRVTLKSGYFDHFRPPVSQQESNAEWVARYGMGKACAARPKDSIPLGSRLG